MSCEVVSCNVADVQQLHAVMTATYLSHVIVHKSGSVMNRVTGAEVVSSWEGYGKQS